MLPVETAEPVAFESAFGLAYPLPAALLIVSALVQQLLSQPQAAAHSAAAGLAAAQLTTALAFAYQRLALWT